MSRIGLGRHSRLDDAAGDPLDGLVNLFDVGIVLAVAFLIAGLGLTRDPDSGRIERERAPAQQRATEQQQRQTTVPLPTPASDAPATGRGQEVGTVYRLPDGRLVYVRGR